MTHFCMNSLDLSIKGTQCFCELGPPAYQACMMDLDCPCMICSNAVVACKPTFKPKAPTNVQTLPCHLPARKSGKHYEYSGEAFKVPQIQYNLFAILCQIFKKVSTRHKMMKEAFEKFLVFASRHKAGLDLESLRCPQKHINHCCIHLGSQVVS